MDKVPFVDLPAGEAGRVQRNTFLFNTFVMCQLFNEINSRKLRNEINVFTRFFSNPVFLGVMAATICGQFLLVQFAGNFAKTSPLTLTQWAVSVAVGSITIPYGLLVRMVIRLKEPDPKKPTAEQLKNDQRGKEEAAEKQKLSSPTPTEEKEKKAEPKSALKRESKGKEREAPVVPPRSPEVVIDMEPSSSEASPLIRKPSPIERRSPTTTRTPRQPKRVGFPAEATSSKAKSPAAGRAKWDVASDVVKEVSVVNALRNPRRRNSLWSLYPTKKEDVRLAVHRRLSKQHSYSSLAPIIE